MEQDEIITEGNKLIAEFAHFPYPVNELKYHTSWDWLMPIVEKIKKDYDFSIQFMNDECNVFVSKQTLNNDEIFSIGGYDNAKEAIWDAVVRFIKWYNHNNII